MAEKLIRDHIPDHIRATGGEPNVRTATDAELPDLLRKKLVEEAHEALSGDPAELADVTEVLFTLADVLGLDLDDLCQTKRRTHGGFDQRWVWTPSEDDLRARVEAASVPDDGTGAWVHDKAAARVAAKALREMAGSPDLSCCPGVCVELLNDRADELERGTDGQG